MSRIKFRDKTYSVPNVAKIAHYSQHETLFYLGITKVENDKIFCLGVGIVKVIEKGEEFDRVGIDFGRGFSQEICVKNNHARRQIYTLKKGQLAWFYGFMKMATIDGKPKRLLYAKGFQGWYVPKNMDIMKIDPNEIDKLTEENESKINFLDSLLNGDDD